MNGGTAVVLRGDARALPLPDESVDLVVTSPPYFGLRSYTDGGEHYDGQIGSEATPGEWLEQMLACTAEWMRVLKPTGSMFVNLGDKYASSGGHGAGATSLRASRSQYVDQIGRAERNTSGITTKSLMGLPWRYAIGCIDQLGLILRAEIVWSKPNGLPESVTDRVRRSHEQWFHLVKQPRYFSAIDEIREPYAPGSAERIAAGFKPNKRVAAGAFNNGMQRSFAAGQETYEPNIFGKLPGSVWEVPTEPLTVPPELGVDHFAAFPTAWPKRLILGWSPTSAVVLDPFGGTGTTALAAKALGRVGISVDLSHDYCRIARWRVNDRAQLAKVVGAPRPPLEVDGQAGLFAIEA